MMFRLRLKNAYLKLKKQDKEEFAEQLKSLNGIDPFKHKTLIIIILITTIIFGWYKISLLLSVIFLFWSILYLVTFLGIYFMWKKKTTK